MGTSNCRRKSLFNEKDIKQSILKIFILNKKQSNSKMQKNVVLDMAAFSLDNMLNPAPEAPGGPLHHLPIHRVALLLNEGNERCLGGMRALVSSILQSAPKDIIHCVQILGSRRPFVLVARL